MRRVAWLPILRLKKCIRKCNVGCMMICLIMIVLWDHLTINNNNVQRHVVVVECDDKHRKPMLESENIIENIIGDRGTLINKEVVQLQKSYNRIQLTELAEFEGHGSSAYETNKQVTMKNEESHGDHDDKRNEPMNNIHPQYHEEAVGSYFTPSQANGPHRICTQEERLERLKTYCANNNVKRKVQPIFYVLERQKLLYCHITKVAGTSLKILMLQAAGSDLRNVTMRVHQPGFMKNHGVRMLMSYTREEQNYMLDNYYKVMVVKHPFSRLVSMWNDKFVPMDNPWHKLGREILDKVRGYNRTYQGSYWSKRPRFHELIKYLAATNLTNNHWKSYERFCHPCSVHWDAILRTETLLQESHLLLDKLNLTRDINQSIPLIHSHTEHTQDLYKISSHLPVFKDVTDDDMRHVLATYGPDLERFGYTWDHSRSMTNCAIKTEQGHCC